jgi:DNA-binding MarR family transcriptional regulator
VKSRGARRWEEPRLAELIKLREQDKVTHQQIAERMGVTKGQVERQVSLLIYEDRLQERTRRPPGADDAAPREWADVRRELQQLYDGNELDHAQMAQRLNITRTQLHSQLHRLFRERRLTPRSRRPTRKTKPAAPGSPEQFRLVLDALFGPDGERHGMAIGRATGLSGETVYAVLRGLQLAGCVTSQPTEPPGRKSLTYSFTAEGRQVAQTAIRDEDSLLALIQASRG